MMETFKKEFDKLFEFWYINLPFILFKPESPYSFSQPTLL